jgi:16S rRNA (cytosine967-C5)-methyltransferase
VTPGRRAAVEVLRIVRERDAFASEVLDATLARHELSREDAAHATRLAYGTMQVLGSLDEAIDRFVRKPGEVEAAVRDVLRMASYELLFGDAPVHAAVDQGVEGVRALRPQAAGLANAVLRRIAGERDAFPWGDIVSDPDAMARYWGHPRWLVDLLIREHGRGAAVEVLRAGNEAAPLYLRHNPYAGDLREALDVLQTDGARPAACDLEGCVWAETPAAAVNGAAVETGRFIVMDAAAQFAAHAVDPRPGQVVADIGAGRGGKTIALQARAYENGGPAEIVAVDVHESKTALTSRRAGALGVPAVRSATADAVDAAALLAAVGGQTDSVLVDAPCTGIGTLRRHPMKRWRLTPEDPARMSRLQGDLLRAAASLVRPGGAVVYSTCTITDVENGQVVKGFLGSEAGRGFVSADLGAVVPDAWRHHITDEGWFLSLPSVGGPDGHFVARLERIG